MGRTIYPDPEAEAFYMKLAATKKLSDDMTVDAYTGGVMSTKAGAEAQSIDEQVRKKR